MKRRILKILIGLLSITFIVAGIFCLSGCKKDIVEYKWEIEFSINPSMTSVNFNEEKTTQQVVLTQEFVEGTSLRSCHIRAELFKYVNKEKDKDKAPVMIMRTDDFKEDIYLHLITDEGKKIQEIIWDDYYLYKGAEDGFYYMGSFNFIEKIGKHEVVFYTLGMDELNVKKQRYVMEIIIEESNKENIYIEMDDHPYVNNYEQKITANGIDETPLFKDYSIYIVGENYSPALRLINDKGEEAPNYNSGITVSYIKIEEGKIGISSDRWRDKMDQGKGLYIMKAYTQSSDTYLRTRAMFFIYKI